MPKPLRDALLTPYAHIQTAHRSGRFDALPDEAKAFCTAAYRVAEWGVTRRVPSAQEEVPGDYLRRLRAMKPTRALGEGDLHRLADAIGAVQGLAAPRAPAEGHASPARMDASYLAASTSWVLAELVRTLAPAAEEVQPVLDRLVAVPRPFAWEREGMALVTRPEVKLHDKVLAVLYFRSKASIKELTEAIPGAVLIAVAGAAARPSPHYWYRKSEETVEITPLGREHAEENLLPRARPPRPGGQGPGRRGRGPRRGPRRGPPPGGPPRDAPPG